MIVRNDRHYYGLHLLNTAVTDVDPKSPNYLRITDLPVQLTSGKNLIKLTGNAQVFLPNSLLYVEVLDSNGKVVYSEFSDFIDSGNRKLLIIEIDDATAPGPALITVVSTLKDSLVSANYRGKINFKWQTYINVIKYESNTTQIIYQNPPEVILQTRIRPFVTTSFRNNEETSTREYGDYEFFDYGFDDYTGDKDSSGNIFQKDKAYKQLSSFTSASISSFNRNNVFYLRPENYSAKTINRNYPDLYPGKGFFVQFEDTIVKDGTLVDTNLNTTPWIFKPGEYQFSSTTTRGNILRKVVATAPGYISYIGQVLSSLQPGQFYLVSADVDARVAGDMYIYLGYDIDHNSGSISRYVTASLNYVGAQTVHYVLRASDGGPYLWIGHEDSAGAMLPDIDNIRVQPLTPLGYDFKHESDETGGYVKIPRPNIYPKYSTDYQILPVYTPTGIVSGSAAYTSYIDFILQDKDAAVDDRFKYQLIPNSQVQNPASYTPSTHKIDTFVSTPHVNYTNIDGLSFGHTYATEFDFTDPLLHSHPLTMIRGTGVEMYGVCYVGGPANKGGIFKYDTNTRQFSILHSFLGAPQGANPNTAPVLVSSTAGRPVLIGTTESGGRFNSGSIYQYDIDTGTKTILYSFGKVSESGYFPIGPIMQASDGIFYGTTAMPIVPGQGYGMMYSYNTSSRVYRVIHQTGSYGNTNLIEHNGELWGTTQYGGLNGAGSIFRFNFSTNTLVHEYDFAGLGAPNGLTMAEPGVFYLTAADANQVLKFVSGSGNPPDIVANLDATSGTGPAWPPLVDSNHLYLTPYTQAANNRGSVIVMNLDLGFPITPVVIHDFNSNPDGYAPKCSLLRIGNTLYGTTTFGGSPDNTGTIFRVDRTGINRPYIEESSGTIYHRNSIVPYEIPANSQLIEDYPRWTGPVVVGTDNLYSIIELELKNLEPLTGDISKVQLYAKPKGVRSEFVDLGIYPTAPVDILLDNNYVNHVQFVDSPYRLTGYFKPTITKSTIANLEASSFKTASFFNGWRTGSITSSYFKEETFDSYISVSATPQSNSPIGSAIKFVLNQQPANNGLAYAVYTASSVPPIKEESDIWQQITYNLFSAAPIYTWMDTGSRDYYTSSYVNTDSNLNTVLVYSGLVTKTSSLHIEDIFALSPNLNNNFDPTGSSVSASSYAHPLTFNRKLGWKTDTYFIPSEIAVTQSLYPALFFEYNTINQEILNNVIDSLYPHTAEVSNILCREVGDRDHIRTKYWRSYTTVDPGGTLVTSASVVANTDVLMDSAKLDVIDGQSLISSSRALGHLYKNKLVFQTVDGYKFYKNVPYIVSFNAVSNLGVLRSTDRNETGDPNFSLGRMSRPGWTLGGSVGWSEDLGDYKMINFSPGYQGTMRFLDIDFFAGTYIFQVEVGSATYSTYENPTSIKMEFANGTSQTIENIQPNSTYTFILENNVYSTADPKITITAAYADSNASLYLLGMSARRYDYDFVSNNQISPIRPGNSKLKVYGVNSTYGVPFADQLASDQLGEFIGELEHKREMADIETKNFGRVEMEFEAETDGFGYLAFESDLGATWYISDISIKPKDRVGYTPGVTRLFVKIPNDMVNKPLTFKVEYLNDIDEKAPYNTILNDVVFSNANEQQSGANSSVNTSTAPTVTGNTNTSGPNSDLDTEAAAIA